MGFLFKKRNYHDRKRGDHSMKKREEYYSKPDSSIFLDLDSYEDLFSDFDPRPYSLKSLSGDFLHECRKASEDKKGKIRIKLFVPKNKRDASEEIKIKKRLKDHFFKHFIEKRNGIRKLKTEGVFWTVLGSVMMILSVVLIDVPSSFAFNLLMTLVQPAGWFFLWEGLVKILITPREKKPDYDFYKKMSRSQISFANC